MIDLRDLCQRIALGAIQPSLRVAVIDCKTVADGPDGELVPVDRPGIIITMDVADAADESEGTLTLLQTFPQPAAVETEAQAVDWIYRCVEAVMVHELQEFFRVDGRRVRAPAHPIPDVE